MSPALPDPTPEQADLLAAVERVTLERRRADERYRAAIRAAADAGCAVTTISKFTDITYQAVQQIIQRRD